MVGHQPTGIVIQVKRQRLNGSISLPTVLWSSLSARRGCMQGPGIRHVSPEGRDLFCRLLAKEPEDRPSAREMLCHPWFHSVMSRPEISGRHRQLAYDVESPGVAGSEMPIVVSHGRRRRDYPEKGERSPSQELYDSASGGDFEDESCAGGAGSSRDDAGESATVQNRRLRA